jgi:rod shape-determining protein MreD
MRWLTFVILAIIAVGLQATVAPRLVWYGARPDWVLVLVVFYALHARGDQAMLAGWIAGVLADLMTLERFGLLSLSYGLAAVTVCGVREALFIKHPLTHFSVTLACALLVQTTWALYRLIVGLPLGPVLPILLACGYTAAWAPPAHWVLLKAQRFLGLGRSDALDARLPGSRHHRV